MTYPRCPHGGERRGQTATAPTLGIVPTGIPLTRATAGQLCASICPARNQSTRCPLAASAQAAYDVQLQVFMFQRSLVFA